MAGVTSLYDSKAKLITLLTDDRVKNRKKPTGQVRPSYTTLVDKLSTIKTLTLVIGLDL